MVKNSKNYKKQIIVKLKKDQSPLGLAPKVEKLPRNFGKEASLNFRQCIKKLSVSSKNSDVIKKKLKKPNPKLEQKTPLDKSTEKAKESTTIGPKKSTDPIIIYDRKTKKHKKFWPEQDPKSMDHWLKKVLNDVAAKKIVPNKLEKSKHINILNRIAKKELFKKPKKILSKRNDPDEIIEVMPLRYPKK